MRTKWMLPVILPLALVVGGCADDTTDEDMDETEDLVQAKKDMVAAKPDLKTSKPDLKKPVEEDLLPDPCANGEMDGDETDVDCGGSCTQCADGKACNAGTDCVSGECTMNICTAAATEDLTVEPGDGGTTEDLVVVTGDQAVEPADMAVIPPDLTVPPPDLVTPPDLVPPPDMVQPPVTSTKLIDGDFLIAGVTTDGYLAYYDYADETLKVVQLAPLGKPVTIAKVIAPYAFAEGKVVFLWSNVDNLGTSPMYVWSAAGGTKVVSRTIAGWATVNTDSTLISYLGNLNTGATTGRIYACKPDLTGAKTLVTTVGISQGDNTCDPRVQFVDANYALASYCAVGNANATLVAYTHSAGTRLTVASNIPGIWSGGTSVSTGGRVFWIDSAGRAQVSSMTSIKATLVDSDVGNGYMLKDASLIIYRTKTSADLRRSGTVKPLPETLVKGGVTGFMGVSPDQKWTLYYGFADAATGLTDLFLASNMAPGKPTQLALTAKADLYGDAFTGDSSHALYFQDVDPTTEVGDLYTQAVTAGAPAKIAANVWYVLGGAGTRFALEDNYKEVNQIGYADIRIGDAKTPANLIKIADQADVPMTLNAAGDSVLYTLTTPGKTGLYITKMP